MATNTNEYLTLDDADLVDDFGFTLDRKSTRRTPVTLESRMPSSA